MAAHIVDGDDLRVEKAVFSEDLLYPGDFAAELVPDEGVDDTAAVAFIRIKTVADNAPAGPEALDQGFVRCFRAELFAQEDHIFPRRVQREPSP